MSFISDILLYFVSNLSNKSFISPTNDSFLVSISFFFSSICDLFCSVSAPAFCWNEYTNSFILLIKFESIYILYKYNLYKKYFQKYNLYNIIYHIHYESFLL